MVIPFLQYVLLSLLLAYLLMPVQRRLQRRTAPKIAAGVIVFVTTVLILVPLVVIVRLAVIESVNLIESVRDGEITLEAPEQQIGELTGVDIDLSARIQSILAGIQVGDVLELVDTVMHLLLGLGLTAFLLYYFLKDGKQFTQWLFTQETFVLSGFLLVWGVTVVGVSDDYLRPIIVDRYAEVNPSIIILGVLGGIVVFGVMGIFYGPVIIGLLHVTLDVFREELLADEGLALEE